MPERRRVPIPFGPGLERETGVTAVQPGSAEDLRNVYFRKGKLVFRRGHTSKLAFTDRNDQPITDVIAGQMLLGARVGVVCTYQGDDTKAAYGDVDLHLIDAVASFSRRLGPDDGPSWFNTSNLDLDPANVPVVVSTDIYNRAFFAHDQPNVTKRAPTIFYDHYEGAELQHLYIGEDWQDFDDELDADEQPKMKFRGVYGYEYWLVGWGWGTPSVDRPDMVRISIAANPKVFRATHYVPVGSRNDPTVSVCAAGDLLAVFKETETHAIVGKSKAKFAVQMIDKRFGCVGSKLTTEVENTCFFWSKQGPRATTGGPSSDLSQPLALDEGEPAGLATEGSITYAWANYLRDERLVLFGFNQRVYVLSVYQRENPRWCYWELGFEQRCGFQLYSTGAGAGQGEDSGPGPGPGPPDADAFADWIENDTDISAGQIKPTWENNNPDGDEAVEIHLRPATNLVSNWRMDTDDDGDGVVNGWSETIAADHTASTSIEDGAQKIDLTGSTGLADSYVEQTITGIEAGKDYTISPELQTDGLTDVDVVLEYAWLDAADAVLASAEIGPFTSIEDFERRYAYDQTAPASATKLRLRAIIRTTTAGGTGTVWWDDMMVVKVEDQGDWGREDTVPVTPQDGSTQSELLEGYEAGDFFEVALRYRVGAQVDSAYEGDPDTWPDISKGVAAPPTAEASLEFQHWFYGEHTSGATGHGLAFKIIASDAVKTDIGNAIANGKSAGFEVWRKRPGVAGETEFSLHDTITGVPEDDWYVDDDLGEDTESENEEDYEYKIRVFIETQVSAFSDVVTRWPGPCYGPTQLQVAPGSASGELDRFWVNDDDPDHQGAIQWFEIEDDIREATGGTAHGVNMHTNTERRNVTAGGSFSQTEQFDEKQTDTDTGLNPGDEHEYRMRYQLDIASDTFYSPYSNTDSATVP